MITLTDKQHASDPEDWFGGRKRMLLNDHEIPFCSDVLPRYGIFVTNSLIHPNSKNPFSSCCAMFIVPGARVKRHPKSLYRDLLATMQTTTDEQLVGRQCFEYVIWILLDNRLLGASRKSFYDEAKTLSRCP
jgi:hypothetical protein